MSYFYNKDVVLMYEPGENAQLRRNAIYKEYERVLAEIRLLKQQPSGIDPEEIAKKSLYERVADNLNYSPEYVRKVIAWCLKNRK